MRKTRSSREGKEARKIGNGRTGGKLQHKRNKCPQRGKKPDTKKGLRRRGLKNTKTKENRTRQKNKKKNSFHRRLRKSSATGAHKKLEKGVQDGGGGKDRGDKHGEEEAVRNSEGTKIIRANRGKKEGSAQKKLEFRNAAGRRCMNKVVRGKKE